MRTSFLLLLLFSSSLLCLDFPMPLCTPVSSKWQRFGQHFTRLYPNGCKGLWRGKRNLSSHFSKESRKSPKAPARFFLFSFIAVPFWCHASAVLSPFSRKSCTALLRASGLFPIHPTKQDTTPNITRNFIKQASQIKKKICFCIQRSTETCLL